MQVDVTGGGSVTYVDDTLFPIGKVRTPIMYAKCRPPVLQLQNGESVQALAEHCLWKDVTSIWHRRCVWSVGRSSCQALQFHWRQSPNSDMCCRISGAASCT